MDIDEKSTLLFNDARMKKRFFMFENICLASLDEQTEKNFIVCVRASELIPENYKKQLLELAKERDYMCVYFLSPQEDAVEYERDLLKNEILEDVKGPVITCRLDDDDGVSKEYTSKLSKYLKGHFFNYVLTFPKGFYYVESQKNIEPKILRESKILIAAGIAFVSGRYRMNKFIMDLKGSHLKYYDNHPVISDPTPGIYIVSAHPDNDCGRFNRRSIQVQTGIDKVTIKRINELNFPGIDFKKLGFNL